MTNLFKKCILFSCVILMITHSSWSQSIVATYNCTAVNATLSLTSTAGVTSYTWTKTGGGFTSTAASITQSSGSFSLTYVKNGTPITLSAFAIPSIIVPTAPTITPPTVATPICGSATQVLTSTTASNYAWQRNGTAIAETTNSIIATGNDVGSPGVYSYTVSTTNAVTGCTSTSNIVALTMSPTLAAPTVSAADGNTLICGSSTQTLFASGGGSSYVWRRGSTTLPNTGSSIVVLGNDATGTFLFTAASTNSTGCSSAFSTTGVSLTLSPAVPIPTILTASISTPICGTATQILTASSGGTSYAWKRSGTVINGITNTITVTGNDVSVGNTYNYTVSTQNAAGCVSAESATFALKVSPKPAIPFITPIAFNPNVICGTDIKSLTALIDGIAVDGTGNTYTWKRNAVAVTTSNVTNSLDVRGTDAPSLTGGTYSYTVSYLNSVGCPSDESAAGVILQLFPTVPSKPTVSNSGILTFCEGGTVNLKSSYISNTNIWSRTAGGDTTTAAADEIIVRSSNNITVKAKDANGCTSVSSNPITVKVNPRPIRPNLNRAGNIEICELDSTEVNATNGYTGGTYSWYKDNTPISSKSNIFLKADGNYTLEYTEGVNQCKSLVSLPTVLKVNLLPVKPTLSTFQSRPLEYCYKNANSGFNFATLLASSVTPNVTFQWDNGRKSNTLDTTIAIRSTKTETIKVSAITISNKGCKSKDKSDDITITVYPLPTTPTITASGPITFCPDSTVNLTSTDSPNGIYKWINAKNSTEFSDKKTVTIDTTIKFFNVTPLGKMGKFYVRTISDKSCLSDTSKNVVVTVRDAPLKAVINPSPISATVCQGGKVTLKALLSNGNIIRYSWRDEATKQEVSTEQEVSVIASGTFTVKVRDVFGCFANNSDPLKVNISPLPIKPSLSIVRPKIFCDEDSTTIQSSLPSTTPNGKNLYTWIVDGQTVLESTSRLFYWKQASSIAVALTDSNGCKAVAISDTIKTTVNPLPASPSITVRGAIPFCADKNVTLSALGTNGVTFKWSTGATTTNITTNVQGTITVQSINGFGCLSKPSQAIQVRVNPLPATPKLTANGETIFCSGSKVRIVSSSPFQAYWWRSTTDSVGKGEDLTSIFASKTGNYFAKVQDNNGCISLASTPINVDAKPNPTPTIVKQIGTFSLDAQGVGDENGYIWRYNGDVQNDLTTRIIKAKKDGNYQVQASITYTGLSIAGGKLVCYSNTSEVIKYVQDLSFNGFSIFPNPTANGEINVEVVEDLIGATITVYSLYGQLISEYKVDKFNALKKIQLPNYAGNTFIVKISTDGFDRTRRVITFKQ